MRSNWLQLFLSLAVVAFSISYKLEQFPNYFFCDEAIHGVEAESLLDYGVSTDGERLPLFLLGFGDYNYSLSIYAQIPFTAVLGNTPNAVRIRSGVFFVLLAIVWAWVARNLYGANYYWLVPSLLCLTPTLFLHARTGFEVSQATSLFGIGVALLIYWLERRAFLPGLFGAFALAGSFYSYVPTRAWVACALISFAIVYARQLKSRWRESVTILGLIFALLAPAIFSAAVYPERFFARANSVGLGGFLSRAVSEQLSFIANRLAVVWDPAFWFSAFGSVTSPPEQRHIIPGLPLLFPVFILPVICTVCLKPEVFRNRLVPFALSLLVLVPIPLLFSEITQLRVLAITLPVVALFVVGTLTLLALIQRWSRPVSSVIATALFVSPLLLTAYSVEVAADRYPDFKFYGAQYGSKQLFEALDRELTSRAVTDVGIASDLFNRGDVFVRFFISRYLDRVRIIDPIDTCEALQTLRGGHMLVLARDRAVELTGRCSEVASTLEISTIVSDPRGEPIFTSIMRPLPVNAL